LARKEKKRRRKGGERKRGRKRGTGMGDLSGDRVAKPP